MAIGVALLTAVFLANGGELTPAGYDGAIGPAPLTGAGGGRRRGGSRGLRPGRGRAGRPRHDVLVSSSDAPGRARCC